MSEEVNPHIVFDAARRESISKRLLALGCKSVWGPQNDWILAECRCPPGVDVPHRAYAYISSMGGEHQREDMMDGHADGIVETVELMMQKHDENGGAT